MALGTPCYQCRRNRNLPLGGWNCRGDPEFQDREAGVVGHSGSIGCGGRPWRRLREISRRESVLNMPAWLAAPALTYSIRFTEKGRRLLRASHFDHSPEEMKRYYFDVLNTGEKLGVAMPHLSALRERIECYPAKLK